MEHPIMKFLIGDQPFLGSAEEVENEIMPLPAQLDFGPGNVGILAMANTQLEKDLVFVKCLDPEEHADTFPDYAERLMNSYVLVSFFSALDREECIGWVSRLKIQPIPKYRYKEARRWLKDGFPEELPEWINAIFLKYSDELAVRAPETVPTAVTCPYCGSRRVDLVVKREIIYRTRAGVLKRDGKDVNVPVGETNETGSHEALLHCSGCEAVATLDDDEWILVGISN